MSPHVVSRHFSRRRAEARALRYSEGLPTGFYRVIPTCGRLVRFYVVTGT